MKKYSRAAYGLIAGLGTILAGCGGGLAPKPETATVAAAVKTPASKTVTSFTPALRCMDDLLLSYGKKGYVITTAGIPDSTGKVAVGTKDMLHTAASKMSIKSKALSFIDYDTTSQDLLMLFQDVAAVVPGHPLPKYYIRGAISQLDENAIDAQAGGGIALSFLDLGASKDQVSSVVGIDMNMGETTTRMIMPGVNASNSLVVTKAGSSKEFGGKIGKVGLSFNMSMNRAEGMSSGVRALVELGMIELIGKLTEVPYWKCLEIEKTNPLMMQQARDFYDGMTIEEQVKFVQRKLNGANLYTGPIDGNTSTDLTSAVGKFQSENGLIADGRVNFDLYYALLDNDIAPAPDMTAREKPLISAATVPMGVTVTSDKGGRYQINDILMANVQTTSDGFLYCYYKDVSGSVARIFPNRFRPNPFIKANSPMSLPSESSPFKIKFDKSGREQVTCYASSRDLVLPPNVKGADLTPLQVSSMDEIANAFRKSNPSLAEAKLDITIR